jgi:hypothetical protein
MHYTPTTQLVLIVQTFTTSQRLPTTILRLSSFRETTFDYAYRVHFTHFLRFLFAVCRCCRPHRIPPFTSGGLTLPLQVSPPIRLDSLHSHKLPLHKIPRHLRWPAANGWLRSMQTHGRSTGTKRTNSVGTLQVIQTGQHYRVTKRKLRITKRRMMAMPNGLRLMTVSYPLLFSRLNNVYMDLC